MRRIISAQNVALIPAALDVLLALSLAVIGARLGFELAQFGQLYFYQFYMPELIYSA